MSLMLEGNRFYHICECLEALCMYTSRMKNNKILTRSWRKYILVEYSSKQKGYKCFNPSTRAVRMSQYVVFDKSASWYKPDPAPSGSTEEELDEPHDSIRPSPLPKDSLTSTELSGPHEPSSIPSTSQPWAESNKGKDKMLEYEINQPDKSDSDESARSLDREFGVPIMRTPDV